MTIKILECSKCGWCHFGVNEAYIQNWEQEWKEFWPKLDKKGKEAYGLLEGPPSRQEFLQCGLCGNKSLETFFETKKSMDGHTLGPIKDET